MVILSQAYKRVGSMMHNGDKGRGVIGVIDVTDLMVNILCLFFSFFFQVNDVLQYVGNLSDLCDLKLYHFAHNYEGCFWFHLKFLLSY